MGAMNKNQREKERERFTNMYYDDNFIKIIMAIEHTSSYY